jgi:hypothetical protein
MISETEGDEEEVNLPRLLGIICSSNMRSKYGIKTIPSESGSATILQRTFFSFGPCINDFQHYRLILCIDGTFLTGKCKGHMLTAIGVDGNNQLL